MKTKPQEIHPPYFLFVLAAIPIFLINFLLPPHPLTPTHMAIAAFVDDHLFGEVGFWSSLFPFSSKVTANYLACFGPLFALFAFYKSYLTMEIDPTQYVHYRPWKFALMPAAIAFYMLLFLAMFYLGSTDLAKNTRKYAFYGAYRFTFSLFSASTLVIFYMTAILLHRCFFYIPGLLLERWKAKRSKNRSQDRAGGL
ncbi:hypothetical protein [Pseudomonas citrulli]|uniref:Uncharacterized protein n=1 Tax=Pseudomonas citrulli TaxID=3064347 RepID=A0ABT9C4B7_9PSED|nr:hypothetical protein [Pseudomonas sp. K18]MDO7899645.1 hypothetical protein [Pseudomonas sp. K18]